MEPFLRDTRHLAGRTPKATQPPPEKRGIAIGLEHEEDGTVTLFIGEETGDIRPLRFDQELDLLVTDDRFCVGRRDAGHWTPCPDGRPADHFDRCPQCHPLPVRECVFNPSCHDCTQELCTSPHQVYIAYHGMDKKVGMTRKARDGTRLVEQGADYAFIVAETQDRSQARNLEDRISSLLGIPQVIPHKRRLNRFVQSVPRETIEHDHQGLAPRIQRLTGTPPGPLQALPRTLERPLPEVPVPVATVGHHTGSVLGVHGRYLFYRPQEQPTGPRGTSGPLWALDLKDIVTHTVRFHR